MDEIPKIVSVIVETPKGNNHKYDYDPKLKRFKLKKILPAGMSFPYDFGFIPNTKGDDGDPLDVIVISEITCTQGSAIDCRIIGAIKAEQADQDGKTTRNDRFLGVPEVSQLFTNVNTLKHLPASIIGQLETFFKNYNEQAGKKFKVLERLEAKEAGLLVKI
jgi:inorganic pyrophosphatase